MYGVNKILGIDVSNRINWCFAFFLSYCCDIYIYIFFALHVYVAYSFPKKSHNWKSLGNPITLPIIANKGKTRVNVRWESISMNYNEHISFYILYSKIDYMWI